MTHKYESCEICLAWSRFVTAEANKIVHAALMKQWDFRVGSVK